MRRLVLAIATVGLLIASTAPADAATANTVLSTGLRSGTVHGAAALTLLGNGTSGTLAVKLYAVRPRTVVTLALYASPGGTGPVLAGRVAFRAPAAGPAVHAFALTRAELDLLRADFARRSRPSAVATATPTRGATVRLVGTFGLPAAPNVDAQAFGTAYAPATGASGGTLTVGDWVPVNQLNPYFSYWTADADASSLLLPGCAAIASDGRYVPDLCASLPSESNGGLAVTGSTFTLTLHLKSGLEWSDGQPLTLNDLKYTWQWANDPAQTGCTNCGAGTAWAAIDAIDVSADGLTATVHFGKPYGGWLSWLTSAILPAHYMSGIAVADAATDSYPAGPAVINAPVSGPFVVTSISSSEIDYARNADFHAGVSPAHQGPAYLDALKLETFPTIDAEVAAYAAGSLDLALDIPSASYGGLAKTPASVGTADVSSGWSYEHLDLNNDPTHTRGNGLWNPAVREALAMAVNKAAIAKASVPGQAVTLACSPTPPNTWYATSEACPAYRPAVAEQLLARAGWRVDRHGWVANAAGHEMDLELCTTAGNQGRLTELQLVQAELKAIHVKSYVKTAPPMDVFGGWSNTSDCSIYRGNYDVADFTYMLSGSPWGDYAFTYAASAWPQLGSHTGGNDTRFSSAPMNTAIAGLASDVQLGAQLYDAHALQDAYAAGIPEIPLYYGNEVTGVGVRVGNWAGNNPSAGGLTWNAADWFVKP